MFINPFSFSNPMLERITGALSSAERWATRPIRMYRFRGTLDTYIEKHLHNAILSRPEDNEFIKKMDEEAENKYLAPLLKFYERSPAEKGYFDAAVLDRVDNLFREKSCVTASELVKKLGEHAPSAEAVSQRIAQACMELLNKPGYKFRNRQLNYAMRRDVPGSTLTLMMERIEADIRTDTDIRYASP
jgi:hypothetical protein